MAEPDTKPEIPPSWHWSQPWLIDATPILVGASRDAYRDVHRSAEVGPNFLKGCQWAPDGSCVLTASDDNVLRVFNTPETLYKAQNVPAEGDADQDDMTPVLTMTEGETIYDYSWYPLMSSYNPTTCCFVSTSRDHPIHLWDAYTGNLRCSYRAFNHLDEITTANSVTFSACGTKLYTGFKENVRIFDVDRPGRKCQTQSTKSGEIKQKGIISCIAMSANQSTFACGSYSKTVGLYDDRTMETWALMNAESGVTQVLFSPSGSVIFASCRQNPTIQCWDLRNTSTSLGALYRSTTTNQRMEFDIDCQGKFLVSGDQQGYVNVFDLASDSLLKSTEKDQVRVDPKFRAGYNSINGISIHPSLPVLATASGKRCFDISMNTSDDSDTDTEMNNGTVELESEASLRIWRFGID